MKLTRNVDMCNGPLFGKILLYALPVIATGILQLLYNTADSIVVGKFAGSAALAAVGSSGTAIGIFVTAFIGLSTGVTTIVAKCYGAQDDKNLHDCVHTAMAISVVGGILLGVISFAFAPQMLRLLNVPDEILQQAVLYVRIYFMGMPAIIVYNFGSGILRAVGDAKRPMLFVSISGIVNVLSNLLLVIVFQLGVVGVAVATLVSQYLSAAMIVICLLRETGAIRLIPSHLKIRWKLLMEIIRVGFPIFLVTTMANVSNGLVSASLNSLGPTVIAGNTASGQLEAFVNQGMNAFYETCLVFSGQNFGAKKPERISRVLRICLIIATLIGVIFGALILLFRCPLLGLYTSEVEVINAGVRRLYVIVPFYFIYGMQAVFCGQLRSIGYSAVSSIIAAAGSIGLRIVWILTVFRWHPSLETVCFAFPASNLLTLLGYMVCYFIVRPRVFRRLQTT